MYMQIKQYKLKLTKHGPNDKINSTKKKKNNLSFFEGILFWYNEKFDLCYKRG